MTLLMQTGVQAVVDTSVSELLEQWIGEQLGRGDAPRRERPRVGVLATSGTLRDGGWPIYGGDAPTVHAILEAGGIPCLIPALLLLEGYNPLQLFHDDYTFALLFDVFWPVVCSLDGLIFTGGGDLYACLYGQQPHPQAEDFDLWRDVWERYLALLSWALCLPTLGICRGMQLMNVATGRDDLPGSACPVARGSSAAFTPSRQRAGLLLQLDHASSATGATAQQAGAGGEREKRTGSACARCRTLHASPGGRGAGPRSGGVRSGP